LYVSLVKSVGHGRHLILAPSVARLVKFETFTWDRIGSTHGVRTDLFPHDLNDVLVTDFFGGVASVEVDPSPLPVVDVNDDEVDEVDETKPSPFSRPVVREGLALGQARKTAEERRVQAARLERNGKWLSWTGDAATEAPAQDSQLVRLGWAAAGAALLGASGWLGFKA